MFYYSNSADRSKISHPIPFTEIVSAQTCAFAKTPFGFSLQTTGKNYELFAGSDAEAKKWVEALNAASDIANRVGKSIPQPPQPSDSGPRPWEYQPRAGPKPRLVPERENSEGWASSATTASGGSSESYRSRSESICSNREDSHQWYKASGGVPPPAPVPATPVDPFAALDALDELAGPAPESCQAAEELPFANQRELFREARARVTGQKGSEGAAPVPVRQITNRQAAQQLREEQMRQLQEQRQQAQVQKQQQQQEQILQEQQLQKQLEQRQVEAQKLQQAQQLQHQQQQMAELQQQAQQAQRMVAVPTGLEAVKQIDVSGSGWDSDDEPQVKAAAPASIKQQQMQKEMAEDWDDEPQQQAQQAQRMVPMPTGPEAVNQSDVADLGWDSDDEPQVKAAAPALIKQQQMQQQMADDWDNDDDCGQKTMPQMFGSGGLTPAMPQNTCGAPMPASQAFVAAKPARKASQTRQASKGGDDLEDLMGDILGGGNESAFAAGSGPDSGLLDGVHCTGCDFQVLYLRDAIWDSSVDYMFFRNSYPTVAKLQCKKMLRPGCIAYCCQCSWRSADAAADFADVAEGLRWRTIGR